jgi:hypothetical protein
MKIKIYEEEDVGMVTVAWNVGRGIWHGRWHGDSSLKCGPRNFNFSLQWKPTWCTIYPSFIS